jgi:tRNA pseudouridine55 synthase
MSTGFLNVYKPKNMTSHDVVNFIRRNFGQKQVGHAGTLDPMAEGVLPIAIGKSCRLIRFLDHRKIYKAEITLGEYKTTDDVTGETIDKQLLPSTMLQNRAPDSVNQDEVAKSLKQFIGEIEQTPPFFSAVHYQGKRLYELARRGILPQDVQSRVVTVHKIEIIEFEPPKIKLRIECSGGTYIRSIARDLGASLCTGAYLSSLMRESSGAFKYLDAVTLPDIEKAKAKKEEGKLLIDPAKVLQIASIDINKDEATKLLQGQKIELAEEYRQELNKLIQSTILAKLSDKTFAVCSVEDDNWLKPETVIGSL